MRGEPLDLRLVPAAVLAWLAAAAGLALGADRAGPAAAAVAGLAALVLGLARGRPGLGPVVVGLAAAAAVLGSCAGQLAARDHGPLAAAAVARSVVTAVGTVVDGPDPERAAWRSGQVRVVVRLEALAVHGTTSRAHGEVLVVGSADVLDLPVGSRVRLPGRLAPLAGRRSAVLTVGTSVQVLPAGWPERVVAGVRARLRDAVAGLGPDERGLVPGAAVGDTSQLSADLEQAMRTAGLSHLVAVSGQHVAVVLLAALAVAGAVRAPRGVRVVLAATAVGGFAVLVGGGSSVLRAVVMGGVAVLGLAVGRPARPVPALGLAVVVLLVHDPWAVGELGFQLSVVATAAIVLLAGPFGRAMGARWPLLAGGVGRRLVSLTLVPLAAQSAVSPVLVLVDPVVSPWAVPANVLAAPAVVPATLLGLAATLTGAWPGVAVPLATAAGVPARWIATVARTTAALPGAATEWRAGPAGALGLAALLAAGWLAGHLLLGRRDV